MVDLKRADNAIVWIMRRLVGRPNPGNVKLVDTQAVFVGEFILATAHGVAEGAPEAAARRFACGPVLAVHREPLPLGGDPDVTVTLQRPDWQTELARLERAPGARLRAEGARHVLAKPHERRVHPVFADAFSDLAVLVDHPDARGALEAIAREREPLRIRRSPITGIEKVYVRGHKGWGAATVTPTNGPSLHLSVLEKVLAEGDCGSPVIDDDGELVGICTAGATVGDEATVQGPLMPLCHALPRWIWERATGTTDIHQEGGFVSSPNETELTKRMKLGQALLVDTDGQRHVILVDDTGVVRPVPEERFEPAMFEVVLKGWRYATRGEWEAVRRVALNGN